MEATFSPPPPSTSSPPPLPVSYTTFPFSLMQTDYVISRFIQVATTFACLFFFSPSVLPSFFLFYFFVAASFCFAKLIQPDSPAAFNQRDDLRFFFAVVGFPWILYPPPNFYTPTHASAVRSVFVLSRPVVLCKREGGVKGVREGLTRDTRVIVVGVRVRVQFILMIWYGACFYGDWSVGKEIENMEVRIMW